MGPSRPEPRDRYGMGRRTIWPALAFIGFVCIYWCASCLVLWWVYHMWNRAPSLIAKMGLIITILTSTIWVAGRHGHRVSSRWRIDLTVAWRTAAVLAAYAVLVIIRLEVGPHTFTDSEFSGFLPVVGHVNSYFFMEAESLSFLFGVAPMLGCISGWLYFGQMRVHADLTKRQRL